MKKSIIILISILSLNISFAQWAEIDLNTDATLHQIYFLNDDIGFMVGDNGQLFRTTNGGDSWTQINVSTSIDFQSVSFANNNIGFINGFKTVDGGLTWTVQPASESFGLIHALDENNLIAGLNPNTSFGGDIYKSSDGGESWEVLTNPIFPSTGAYNDVCFVNENLGYLSAWYSSHLVRTIDGGETWTEIVINEVDGASFYGDDYRGVDFLNEEIGLVTYENGILKTIDGGNTWSEISPEGLHSSFYPESIIALSEDNYIMVGGFPGVEVEKIYETSDAGISWSEAILTTAAFFDVNCISTACFAVGSNGKVYKKEALVNSTSDTIKFPTFNIYPNPVDDVLNIETQSDLVEIRIFNTKGELVSTFAGKTKRVDISLLQPGVYFVNFIYEMGVRTQKIIKE